MLTPQSRLRPKPVEIAAEVVDGEAIIINLTNGMYYSLDLAGGLIWALIDEGRSLEEIARAVTVKYEVSFDQARADVERIAAELLEQKLVVETSEAVPPPLNGPAPGQRLAYERPELQSYSDMGDLLALDPPLPGLEDVPWQGPPQGPPQQPSS
jgi:hypothetical protein